MVHSGQWEGQQLGNYQLIQLLGQGHWASIYLGEHLHLHTQAAIKVLQGPWAGSEVEGFLGEARTLAYMAPEQLEGHPTLASDQYALGVLVYEWLAG